MNALAAAIREQYQRQQEAIRHRDADLQAVRDVKIREVVSQAEVYYAIREAIHKFHQPEIDDATRLIGALEAVRDASAEGGE